METNAVVDPRAMMVHLENAHSTNTTMMAPIWLILTTPLATAAIARTLALLHRGRITKDQRLRDVLPFLAFLWDGSWMHQDAPQVAYAHHNSHKIEEYELYPGLIFRTWLFQHGHTMVSNINSPKQGNEDENEYHWKAFERFIESALLRRKRIHHPARQ